MPYDPITNLHFNSNSIAIVVGRFQNYHLHNGYISLLNYCVQNYRQVVILVGYDPTEQKTPTLRNPFPLEMVQDMLWREIKKKIFPNDNRSDIMTCDFECKPIGCSKITISSIPDIHNVEKWNDQLDTFVEQICKTGVVYDVTLVGSRDSFVGTYTGKYDTHLFRSNLSDSSTKDRISVKNQMQTPTSISEDFMKGALWMLCQMENSKKET